MKNVTQLNRFNVFIYTMTMLLSFNMSAQVLDNFTPRFNQTVKGDMTIIANNVLSTTATGDYNGSAGNHSLNTVNVDIDSDPTTFNSSSANFVIPNNDVECLSVIKAYLYWAAADYAENGVENQPNWNFNDVKLMLPGQTNYTTITADEVIFRGRDTNFSNEPYICVKDITSQINTLASPYGKYQIGNVEAKTGNLQIGSSNIGTSGGWQIVFIYESPLLPAKNVSIFDGYAHVTSSVNNFNIDFNGFQTVPTGNVNADVIIGALEGDLDLSGDRLQIRNVANNFIDISTPQRSASNFFNSKITTNGSQFLDRNPASTNTLGYDAAVFRLDNPSNSVIGNNQSSATIRLTSNQETYGLYLLGFSVDVWAPNLNPIEMVLNSGSNPVAPSDTLGFSFAIQNTGNDDATNLSVSTTLPTQASGINANNLPAGVTFNFNPVTGNLVFNIPNSLVAVGSPQFDIDFEIIIQEECYFLEENCDLSFDLQFVASYNGVQNPNLQNTLSSAGLDECNIGDLLPLVINIIQPDLPNWSQNPSALNVTLDCEDTSGLNDAQLLEPTLENCDLTITKTAGSFVVDPNCSSAGTYTNTFTAIDACGRTTSEFFQTITIGNANNPVITIPDDVTIDCNDDTAPTNTGEATASVNCGSVDISYVDTIDETCGNTVIITRTWTATDDCGNTTSENQIITTQDTTAPTFVEALPADATVECDAIPSAETLTATDNCGDATVTFNEVENAGACAGEYTLVRTWTATDECGNETVHTQTITVQDTTAPTFVEALPADATVECDAIPSADTLTASDNCGDATVTFDEVNTPGACAGEYTLVRTWTATDECGNETTHTQTITVVDTTAPTFVEALPADATVECDAIPTAETLTATDNCGDATVTFNEVENAGACAGVYTIVRTWTATDECGNETVHTQTITVVDNTAPTFVEALPADATAECDAIPTAETLTATDNCGTATITFNEVENAGTCSGEYTLVRTWTATDECGNQTVHTQTITVVDNTAPTFVEALPADATVECDAIPTAETLTATDNCGIAEVTFGEETSNGDCAGEFIITRTWTATDECGNETVHTQIISVRDTTAPSLTNAFETNIFAICNDIPEVPQLVFEDACSNDISVVFIENSTQTDVPQNYQIIREWTVTDDCGNESIFTQTINVSVKVDVSAIQASICIEDIEVDLFDYLPNDISQGGTWTVVTGNADLDGSLFDPSNVELGDYTFRYNANDDVCFTQVILNLNVNDDCVVLSCGEDDVEISKAVTPNNDLINDFFTVTGIEDCGFVVEVEIFNRWGAKIFESKNYQNNWGGETSKSSVGNAGKVPTGTYYYIVKLRNSGLRPFTGPIYVATK
ncbi:gliding motility-associated C-terminal domain-containing protein [Paucihalobacter sp.]|uniref:HYR-like domain-containing protein n=2 Tax=Paucihalobacter sp. TaxID=2850405 RepID=UPI003D161BB9